MPVYNEDVARVFSGVRAICESVAAPDFDFYILSDSTDPANWVAEEMEWQKLKNAAGPGWRASSTATATSNIGRKSGNIQDFCENWGQLYDYMVVLDADSLMTGATLTTLVGLMDANPRTALIQAPAQLVGRAFAVRPHPAIRLQRLWPDLQCRAGLPARARRQLLGPQRHHPRARLHAALRIAQACRQAALRRRDHEP